MNGTINGTVAFPFWFDPPPGGALAHVTVNGDVIMNAQHQEMRNSTINGNISGYGFESVVDHSTVNGWIGFTSGTEGGHVSDVSNNRVVGGIFLGAGGSENSVAARSATTS